MRYHAATSNLAYPFSIKHCNLISLFTLRKKRICMRIQSLDAIRGFAVLGILFMNIAHHMNILTGYVPFDNALVSDSIISFVQLIFADGKFRTLFCILFGAGTAILYENGQRQSVRVKTFLHTRLNWLFVFGLAHAVFIFGGDILMLYAVSGIILVNYLHLDNESLFKKSRFFIVLGALLMVIVNLLTLLFGNTEPITRGSQEYAEMLSIWQDGYLTQVAVQSGIALGMLLLSFLYTLWLVLGLMGLGVWLYRTRFFSTGFGKSTQQKLLAGAILTTLVCIAMRFSLPGVDEEISSALFGLCAIIISPLYADFLIKHANNDNRLFRTLSYCGQVALSLYLIQSISMALLFRLLLPVVWPDFELYITRIDLMAFALLFTIFQIYLARAIVKNFSHGPFEFVWRKRYRQGYIHKVSENAHCESETAK